MTIEPKFSDPQIQQEQLHYDTAAAAFGLVLRLGAASVVCASGPEAATCRFVNDAFLGPPRPPRDPATGLRVPGSAAVGWVDMVPRSGLSSFKGR